MNSVPGFSAARLLLAERAGMLLRAEREGRSFLLRIPREPHRSPDEHVRIRYSYELSNSLDIPGIARAVELTRNGNGFVLVMEDFGGLPLRLLLADGALPVPRAVRIARQLAEVLGQLHLRRIVYKSLNPSNVLVNPETDEVRIANFDFASRLTVETPGFSSRDLPEELAYVSPEQTGRMNRSVDYRTDLYSLGAVLYEMLTGRPPVEGRDALSLVYQHLAVEPLPPHRLRPELPLALSSVVLKLLAKNAEDRYQSAYGLSADLQECLSRWERTGTIADLPLGQKDVSAALRLPQKLYGREQEAARLSAAFERVSAGNRAELLLISGYSGVGKTALVHELYRPLTRQAGNYASGKFDTVRRAPYSAWLQAFDSLFRQILSEDEAGIARWRDTLLDALGANAGVITDVVPRLERIIGPQPPVPELGPAESQNRFHLAFQRLVEAFARREHPLVLFLDDLQWADAASLGLLQHLLAEVGPRHLLVIGAYRDNEVRAGHPLLASVDELRKSTAPVTGIDLPPLGLESIRQFLADTVARPGDAELDALVTLVYQKTQGNPFFVGQFITSLHARGLLMLDPGQGQWRWNLERIQSEPITDNVATLMAERLRQLSPATQEVLKRAACIGNRFTLETLAVISERSPRESAADLWEALQQGLLLPVGEAYKYVQHEGDGGPSPDPSGVLFEFLHDRVQEAAYSLMTMEASQALHLRIGRLLLHSIPREQREGMIFDIVHQLNRAIGLIDDAGERKELADLNLMAGLRAKGSSAYAEALGYLQAGVSLLPEDCWESRHELALPLHRHRSECLYLLGRMDEADQGFQLLLSQASAPLEKGEIYLLLMELAAARGRFTDGLAPAREGLKALGLELPGTPEEIVAVIAREQERWKATLARRPVSSFVELPETKDATEQALVLLLSRFVVTVAYLYPDLYLLCSLLLVNRSQEHGLAPGSGIGYLNLATTMGGQADQHALAFELGQLALKLNERHDPRRELPISQFGFSGFINPWCRPYATSIPFLKQAFQGNLDVGSFIFSGLSATQMGWLAHLSGEDLDTQLQRMQWYLDFHLGGGVQFAETVRQIGGVIGSILRLKHGELPPGSPPYFEINHLAEHLQNPGAVGPCYVLWLRASYLLGTSDVLELLEKATQHIPRTHGHVFQTEFLLYQGLALASFHAEAGAEERARYEQILDASVEALRRYSAVCPENFLQKHLLLAAERAMLASRELEAMGLYDDAIAAAARAGQLHEEGLANERAARFHLAKGRKRVARSYLEDARAAYGRWGARAKVALLEREFPGELRSSSVDEKAGGSGLEGLDLASVLKASQAISGEVVLPELLHRLMGIILESAGAQRGLLLLKDSPLVVDARQAEKGGSTVQLHPSDPKSLPELPWTLMRYVERSGERIVLQEATREGPFQQDPYIARERVRSVLCIQLMKQKQALGTLYLENNLVAGAFTPERCKILELLSTQAAISLENARLYETLDQRVQERTRELHTRNEELFRALEELKQAQSRLIMQEKLASLGTLVSGIAHEIKNPLNFINNFADLSADLTRELAELLSSERAHLERQLADQMLDLSTTLRENVTKINEHGKRADSIVRSMLELSHLRGDAEQTEVDINNLIEQFARLAYQGFRTQNPSFTASVVTRFAPLPRLKAIAPNLGRVILNLVNNSCYALASRLQTAGGHLSPEIQLSTRELEREVEIRVRDNGTGIPAGLRSKIFNPFFTTKPPGQGTGLGLSISHEIVVQEHGGRLEVSSEEGRFTEFLIALPKRR